MHNCYIVYTKQVDIQGTPTTVAVLAILLDRSPPAQLWACVVRGEVYDETCELVPVDCESVWIRVMYLPTTFEMVEFPKELARPFILRTWEDVMADWFTKTGRRKSHFTQPWVKEMGRKSRSTSKSKSKGQAAESDADVDVVLLDGSKSLTYVSTPSSTPTSSRHASKTSTKRTSSPGDGKLTHSISSEILTAS